MENEKLEELRSDIDKLDEQIIVLFLERQEDARQIGLVKKANNWPIIDLERKKLALAKRLEWAHEVGLAEEDLSDLFEFLHKKAVEKQTA